MSNKKRPITKVCPDCSGATLETSFGMPVAEDPSVIHMGCIMDFPRPTRGCKGCGWLGDYIDADGTAVELDFLKDEED